MSDVQTKDLPTETVKVAPMHVMVDLETWGTGPDAKIISLGAVMFDSREPVTVEGSPRFHSGVIPQSYDAFAADAFSQDASTVLWWMTPERREALDAWLGLEKSDIASVLTAFAMWMNSPDKIIWGNGATFDNVILRNAYMKVLGVCPWSFRNDRCYRTMSSFAPDITLEPFGTAHNALNDAMWQARRLQMIASAIGITL